MPSQSNHHIIYNFVACITYYRSNQGGIVSYIIHLTSRVCQKNFFRPNFSLVWVIICLEPLCLKKNFNLVGQYIDRQGAKFF